MTGESNIRRKKLLHLLDADGSGELSFEEFGQIIGIPVGDVMRVQEKLRAQELRRLAKIPKWSAEQALKRTCQIRWYGMKTRCHTPSQRHQTPLYLNRSVSVETMPNYSAEEEWMTSLRQPEKFSDPDSWRIHMCYG